MKSRFRTRPELALVASVVSLISFSAQAAELSGIELKKAQKDLLGFEISGRGIQAPEPFTYDGAFPRAELTAELDQFRKLLLAEDAPRPILIVNALKREQLSDAELVSAVRAGRLLVERLARYKEKES